MTGSLLVAFAVSVWAYSISAVKQDNFDDIDAAALDQRQHSQVELPHVTAPEGLVKIVTIFFATLPQLWSKIDLNLSTQRMRIRSIMQRLLQWKKAYSVNYDLQSLIA